jgi:hypothetical protein
MGSVRSDPDRRGVSLQRPILEMGNREEPERKRRKSILSEQVVEEEGKTQEDKTATVETVENVENEVETFPQPQNVLGSCWF